MTDLNIVTSQFGRAYQNSKKWDTSKKNHQDDMFDAFTEALEGGVLAQRLVTVPTAELDVKAYIARMCPGWRYVSHEPDHILVEEDPALMKYQHVNTEDGYVYARTLTESGPSLDDEALRTEDPDLWQEISAWPEPWYSLVKDALAQMFSLPVSNDVIESAVDGFLTDRNVPRTIKDPNQWTEDQLQRAGRYFLPGQISTRLVAPRKATSEELGEV